MAVQGLFIISLALSLRSGVVELVTLDSGESLTITSTIPIEMPTSDKQNMEQRNMNHELQVTLEPHGVSCVRRSGRKQTRCLNPGCGGGEAGNLVWRFRMCGVSACALNSALR